MLSLLEQQDNANYVRGRMCSLILLWERFYNVHVYENYHIVHLKLRRYLNKSVEWTWKDRKKGSKCHFCCEQGSIPGAEEKHVVHSLHLCFLAEFFQGACGRFLEGWSDAVQPNSIPLWLGVSFLCWSLLEHVVELMDGRQMLGLEVGEMSHRYLKPTEVFKTSCYRL